MSVLPTYKLTDSTAKLLGHQTAKKHQPLDNVAQSLVKGLIVLVKLTHDDELQSQDALL